MKINIGYSTKSIDKALKQIEEYQKKLQSVIPKFLQRCADKIIENVNERLSIEGSALGLSGSIIADIQKGWKAQPVTQTANGHSIKILNETEKATYIEFGVGAIGARSAHKQASQLGYGYDLNNHGNWGWSFYVHNDDDKIDIGTQYRDIESIKKDGTIEIVTRGQPATMFAYNGVMDFVAKKEYVPIMEELLKGL